KNGTQGATAKGSRSSERQKGQKSMVRRRWNQSWSRDHHHQQNQKQLKPRPQQHRQSLPLIPMPFPRPILLQSPVPRPRTEGMRWEHLRRKRCVVATWTLNVSLPNFSLKCPCPHCRQLHKIVPLPLSHPLPLTPPHFTCPGVAAFVGGTKFPSVLR